MFKKGVAANPAGKPKGPNTNRKAREAIAKLVERNMPVLEEWLDEIKEKEGALAAWRCFMDVVEYHIPKQQRIEHKQEGGDPFVIEVRNFLYDAARKSPGK